MWADGFVVGGWAGGSIDRWIDNERDLRECVGGWAGGPVNLHGPMFVGGWQDGLASGCQICRRVAKRADVQAAPPKATRLAAQLQPLASRAHGAQRNRRTRSPDLPHQRRAFAGRVRRGQWCSIGIFPASSGHVQSLECRQIILNNVSWKAWRKRQRFLGWQESPHRLTNQMSVGMGLYEQGCHCSNEAVR